MMINTILDIHISDDMNITIHIDINIDITPPPPPTPTPCSPLPPAPSADGPGMLWGEGGDINIHIDSNVDIDIHIIANMNNILGLRDHFQVLEMLEGTCAGKMIHVRHTYIYVCWERETYIYMYT